MSSDIDKKAELLAAVEDWIDRALSGEAETLTLTVIDDDEDQITINLAEGYRTESEDDILPN